MKRVLGLTGNIGCGKSTVLQYFKEFREIEVVMTDQLAKEIMEEPEVLNQVAKTFGSPVVSHWQIDYSALRKTVYTDERLFRELEAIVHPRVWGKVEEIIANSTKEIILVESAIILETGSEGRFHSIILTTCHSQTQKERLEKRGHTPFEISRIRDRQFPSEYKEKHSGYVIDTDGSHRKTKQQVREIAKRILEETDEY